MSLTEEERQRILEDERLRQYVRNNDRYWGCRRWVGGCVWLVPAVGLGVYTLALNGGLALVGMLATLAFLIIGVKLILPDKPTLPQPRTTEPPDTDTAATGTLPQPSTEHDPDER